MEPSVVGSWSKRPNKAMATSSDEAPRPPKRSKHRASDSECSSSDLEEGEHDRKYTSDLLLIRDVVEELQSNEREFHRSQQARYECLKRTIIEMESRWTKEKHKRSMARVRRERRALEERLRLTEMGRCVVTPVRDSGLSLLTPEETTGRVVGFGGEEEEDRFTALQKRKQVVRVSGPIPGLRSGPTTGLLSPSEPAYRDGTKRRKSRTPAVINSSDGDDEDEAAEELQSLQNDFAQQAGISNDSDALDWPADVGIGSESVEVEMHDGPRIGSPLTVCAVDTGVPVCPGPFRMTPQLKTPMSPHTRSLRKRSEINYELRLDLGLTDDDMGPPMPPMPPTGRRRGVKSEFRESDDESYRPETVHDVESSNVTASTSRPDEGILQKESPRNTAQEHPKPRDLVIKPKNPSHLFSNGLLVPLSDDDSDYEPEPEPEPELEQMMDVDLSPPPPPTRTTRDTITTLGPPPPALNLPVPMIRFSRSHIQKALGGKLRGTVTVVKQNAYKPPPVTQFLCINGKHNPHYPAHPGANGAMFLFRSDAVALGSEWGVFCNRPRVGGGPQETFEYVGHYVVRDIDDLGYEEWMGSGAKFREGWVNYIAREAKAPKGWARLNLVSRGLVRGDEPVLPEQVMGWFNAAEGSRMHARLGRRVLEFREFKRGLYDSLVRAKQIMDERKLEDLQGGGLVGV